MCYSLLQVKSNFVISSRFRHRLKRRQISHLESINVFTGKHCLILVYAFPLGMHKITILHICLMKEKEHI